MKEKQEIKDEKSRTPIETAIKGILEILDTHSIVRWIFLLDIRFEHPDSIDWPIQKSQPPIFLIIFS